MTEHLMGVESEYAFTARRRSGASLGRSVTLARLMNLACRQLPHLPSLQRDDMFLQNGARFYVDRGDHPEMTTPECAHPWDVVRYIKAGEEILTGLVDTVVRQGHEVAEILLFRCNVDYSGMLTTWACHENYLHRTDQTTVIHHLIPHLVSRVCYTGAGGFDPYSPGLVFMLSPRVAHLASWNARSRMPTRGSFHTKDEPLGGHGFQRLHLVCGESLCSEIAIFLKTGVTALIVALIEAGRCPTDSVQLPDPWEAMRVLATDPDCRAVVRSATGKELTAIEIQRYYLSRVEAHADAPFMPLWAEAVCREWRAMLDRLEQGAPASVATTLDWAVKYVIYQSRVQAQGMNWHQLAVWTDVINRLKRALKRAAVKNRLINARAVLSARSPVRAEVDRLRPVLTSHGLAWENLDEFLKLRLQLFEIDTRFGQLGSKGIFSVLESAGALQHHVPGVDGIEDATANPPTVGRARLRGRCVSKLSGSNGRYVSEWDRITDRQQGRFLDLSDPFASEEKWEDLHAKRSSDVLEPAGVVFENTLAANYALYEQGEYERAHQQLSALQVNLEDLDADQRFRLLRYRIWVESRRGFPPGSDSLNELAHIPGAEFAAVADALCMYRFQGLVPSPDIQEWIRRGQELLAQDQNRVLNDQIAFLGYQGFALMRSGRLQEALAVLDRVCQPPLREQCLARVRARAFADQGELNRLLGNRRAAFLWLRQAGRLQESHGYLGDLADLTFIYRAKLQTDPRRARMWLKKALRIQTDSQNRMGEARSLLLEARLRPSAHEAALHQTRILELKNQLPALGQCRLLAQVLAHWQAWVRGDLDPDGNGDLYWGM